MNTEQLFLACTFTAVAMVGYALAVLFRQNSSAALQRRLRGGAGASTLAVVATPSPSPVAALLKEIGQRTGKAFGPQTTQDRNTLRRELGYAGIYSRSAVHILAGAKLLALAAGLAAGYAAGLALKKPWLGTGIGGLIGYSLPLLWLNRRIRAHRLAIELGLPDALDLLVVCVEAGLTVDAAMQRVAEEVALAHPALARELSITHMEAQMGLPREEAMRNFATRTGSTSVQSLTSMLIQTERFGTGIARALRVHAESMRVSRQNAAEEMAAKAAVKMSFPLVLCIFPAMLIVVGGPAVIRIMDNGFLTK